jgi:hypothetical protein
MKANTEENEEDEKENRSLVALKEEVARLDTEIEQRRRQTGNKSHFLSELKVRIVSRQTGILSVCTKNGVQNISTHNFNSKSSEVRSL